MRATIPLHVSPILLWQCLCGGSDLPKADHQHLVECVQCETLAEEIAEALDDIQLTLERRGATVS